MAIQWLDASGRPMSAERAGAAPAPPAPSKDVQYVNGLADDFAEAEALDGYVVDEIRVDWAGVAFVAAVVAGLAGWVWALDALLKWRLR
jgi:hypothetical protein